MTATELPTCLLPTLSGHYYTSPDIFAAEQAGIFETTWCAAMRAADLHDPGDFRTVGIGRESILVVRGRDRKLRAFLNICRHRGARLCLESTGTVRRSFQCPYHAWTYGLDGKLVAAPNLTSMEDIDRRAFGLHEMHLTEWAGYAWVCLAEQPPSFEDTVIGQVTERLGDPEAIASYGLDRLQLGRRIVYDVQANWKLLIENFMECYHCATIHPELTEVLPEFGEGYAAQYYVGHGARFGEDVDGFTVDGRDGVGRLAGVDDAHDRRYYAITVLPAVFINLVPDHVIFHRMFPVTAERTVVECDWLYAEDVVTSGTDLSRSVELFDRVNRQDFDACERCQPAMSSRAYSTGGVLVPSEHHIGHFHAWLHSMLSGREI